MLRHFPNARRLLFGQTVANALSQRNPRHAFTRLSMPNITNLVLTALLNYSSEFATKLDLPLELPLTTNQVAKWYWHESYPSLMVWTTLKSGDFFALNYGQITCYRGTLASSEADRAAAGNEHWSRKSQMTQLEIIAFARQSLERLGYTATNYYTDLQPEVKRPRGPNYQLRWFEPNELAADHFIVEVEVDAYNRRIVSFRALGAIERRRPEPEIPGLAGFVQRDKASLLTDIPLSKRESLAQDDPRLNEALPGVRHWMNALKIPTRAPERLDEFEWSGVDYDDVAPRTGLRLKSGQGFRYDLLRGRVVGYISGRSFFLARGPVAWREFQGTWRLTEREAARRVQDTVRELGFKMDDLLGKPPEVVRPTIRGPYTVPRYYLKWEELKGGWLQQAVEAEVDGESGAIASLHIEK